MTQTLRDAASVSFRSGAHPLDRRLAGFAPGVPACVEENPRRRSLALATSSGFSSMHAAVEPALGSRPPRRRTGDSSRQARQRPRRPERAHAPVVSAARRRGASITGGRPPKGLRGPANRDTAEMRVLCPTTVIRVVARSTRAPCRSSPRWRTQSDLYLSPPTVSRRGAINIDSRCGHEVGRGEGTCT